MRTQDCAGCESAWSHKVLSHPTAQTPKMVDFLDFRFSPFPVKSPLCITDPNIRIKTHNSANKREEPTVSFCAIFLFIFIPTDIRSLCLPHFKPILRGKQIPPLEDKDAPQTSGSLHSLAQGLLWHIEVPLPFFPRAVPK